MGPLISLFWTLVRIALGKKPGWIPGLLLFSSMYDGFIRFTSGATPADVLIASIAAEFFYRLRSEGNVCTSVCHSVNGGGGGSAFERGGGGSAYRGICIQATPPPPPPGIRSTRGRYPFYWNAYLFIQILEPGMKCAALCALKPSEPFRLGLKRYYNYFLAGYHSLGVMTVLKNICKCTFLKKIK